MSDHGSDSDAPEELTNEEGIKQEEELRIIQKENAIRVALEGKERRRQWARRNAQAKSNEDGVQEAKEAELPEEEAEEPQEGPIIPGMLSRDIVELLAAREKKTFSSDSEEEIVNHKPTARKKKQKTSGHELVILSDTRPAQCQQNSIDFLNKRKMQVPRSSSVLKNSNQALRLLSSRGGLLNKS